MNEDGTIVRSDALNESEEIPHGDACGDEALELLRSNAVSAGGVRLAAARGGVNERGHALSEYGDLNGLLKIVGRALADCGHGGLGGVVRSHQDDIDEGIEGDDLLEDLEAAHVRHDEVGDDELRTMFADEFEALDGIGGGVYFGARLGESGGEELERAGIVVDDNDGNRWRHTCSTEIVTRLTLEGECWVIWRSWVGVVAQRRGFAGRLTVLSD